MAVLVFRDAGWCGWPFDLDLGLDLDRGRERGVGGEGGGDETGEGGDAGEAVGQEAEGD